MADRTTSDDLIEALADQLQSIVDSVMEAERSVSKIPDVDKIQEAWDDLNKKLEDLDEMTKPDYLIKNSNEFYFVSMFLKAAKAQALTRRDEYLSDVSQAKGLAVEDGFIRKNYKELKKAMYA